MRSPSKVVITALVMIALSPPLVPPSTAATSPRPTAASLSSTSSRPAPIQSVIQAIRDALNEAQSNNVASFPPLKRVTIELQTVLRGSSDASLNLVVLSLGTEQTLESSSRITLEMEPPETPTADDLGEVDPHKLKSALAQAINLAKQGTLGANRAEPKLLMKQITIEIKFSVEAAGSLGAETANLLPVGMKGTGKLGQDHFNTLTLMFGE